MTDARDAPEVVFDISVLNGIGAANFQRAGIFRVVDRLTVELARRDDCRLILCCSNPVLEVDEVLAGLAHENPDLGEVLTTRLWHETPAYAAARRALRDARKVPGESLFAKVRRAWFRRRLRTLRDRLEPGPAVAPQGAIFHSPWDPLPEHPQFAGRRALTVYDMTPVLFPHFFPDNRVFNGIMRSVAPEDHILAISECTKRDFCAVMKHDPARVHVTPLAADPDMFHPVADADSLASVRARYAIPPGRYLLSVNTVQPRKNLAHAIDAFCELVRAERLDDLALVLVGDRGWQAGDVDRALRRAGPLARRIVRTGYVPDADLAALYSGALAFVYVSHYEGFGLPPLEAMQCGVPVICADNSSLPEVVGDAGLLVPATDRPALCHAMLTLYRDDALRQAFARRALDRARGFTWARCAALTVAAYRQMRAA